MASAIDLPQVQTTGAVAAPAGLSFASRRTVAVSVLLIAGAAAYFQLFSSFAAYDDEGYVHLSLRTFLAGHPLYDETCTQYGPAFFLVQQLVHSVTGLPVTHDVARFKTLLVWLCSAGLAAAIVLRLTERRWWSLLAFLGTFLQLDRLGLEPGHPQDLVLPLLLLALWLAVCADAKSGPSDDRTHLSLALGWGAVIGLIALTKSNVGILTGLGCLLTLVASLPDSRGTRVCVASLTLGLVALPLGLARQHLFSLSGAALPAAVMAGGIAWWLSQSARGSSHGTIRVRTVLAFATASAATGLLCCGLVWMQGTSLNGLWYGLVGQHRGFLDLFYHDPPLPAWSLGWSVAGLALAVGARRSPRWWLAGASCVPFILLFTTLTILSDSWQPIWHGLDDRAGAGLLAAAMPPLAWLIIAVPLGAPTGSEDGRSRQLLGRQLLCLMTLLQPLAAFPTPGTQLAIGTLPALLTALVGLSDLLDYLSRTAPQVAPLLERYAKFIAAVLLISLACRDARQLEIWSRSESLALPGAQLLRLPVEEARARRAVVEHLSLNADLFVASPTGCCSFYLWTEQSPPTTFNTTFWEVLLTHEQQRQVIKRLEMAANPRVIIDRLQAPVIHVDAPLHQYLTRRFVRREVEGLLEVWAPAEAAPLQPRL